MDSVFFINSSVLQTIRLTTVIISFIFQMYLSHVHENILLSDCQYGFGQNKNISDALFDVNKENNQSLFEGMQTMSQFLN